MASRDVRLIDMLKLCPSPKPILTTYPGAPQGLLGLLLLLLLTALSKRMPGAVGKPNGRSRGVCCVQWM